MYRKITSEIKRNKNPKRALLMQKYFKTGKGEYGESDIFLGLSNPVCRKISKKYTYLLLDDINKLLHSPIHEQRLIALLILVEQYHKGDLKRKNLIYRFYLKNSIYINNWDLVDLTAHKIVGDYLLASKKSLMVLKKLARSKLLWKKRIAVISTFAFLKNNDCKPSLEIAGMLLHDRHDLIHKAVGWVLREVGKSCGVEKEKQFLDKYASIMPRTMLRYAIEKFDEPTRKKYLAVKQAAA